jgi:hypothetical protein
MNKNTVEGQIIVPLAHSSCLLLDDCWYDCQIALMDESGIFLRRRHSTMVSMIMYHLGDEHQARWWPQLQRRSLAP